MFNLTDNNTNQDAEKATAKASTSKVKKPRFKKLTGAEVADLPGVNSATLKAVEPDLTYFIYFAVPLTDLVGSVTEANQIHDFAYKLDVEAKANKVGSVTTVAFGSGSAEIVLKLEGIRRQTGEFSDLAVLTLNQQDLAPVPDQDIFLILSRLDVVISHNLCCSRQLS